MKSLAEPHLLGEAADIVAARAQIRAIARFVGTSVLILGETGTGKSLAAQVLHAASDVHAPLVTLTWSGVPWDHLEREVFGDASAEGAARIGLLGSAGTLLVDEIGEMPEELQGRLVRALDTHTYRPVGGVEALPLRARIVSTTGRNAAEARNVRADLLYRLAGSSIALPPLRERVGDIQELTTCFLSDFAARHDVTARLLDQDALLALEGHDWPGNVRELKSVVEQLSMSAEALTIGGPEVVRVLAGLPRHSVSSIPPRRSRSSRPDDRISGVGRRPSGEFRLRELERDLILQAYRAEGGNLSRAAARLGIPRTTLRDKVKRLGLEVPVEGGDKR